MSPEPSTPGPSPIPTVAGAEQPLPSTSRPTPSGKPPMSQKLEGFLHAMVNAGASDLHLKVGLPPIIRVSSMLRQAKSDPLAGPEVEQMARSILTPKQIAFFEQYGGVDLAHEFQGGDRFRINIFRQRGDVSIAIRRVTRRIPDFTELHLPPTLAHITEETQGLVLLVGPTGSGKSTTIASMLEFINQHRRCHIITIEDPIEYLYDDKRALISQREIGIDVPNFDTALRMMLREDPDIVLIGEMRDRETFEAALQASETGHLVFGTIHAGTAPQTIARILELFPQESRKLVLQSLSFNLKAIICQKLLPCIKEDIDRVPAVEIMLANPVVRNLIEHGRDAELGDVIRSHEQDGMQSFTKSLYDLIQKDLIDPKIAYEVAPNVEELKMILKGIKQSRTGLVGRQ
jgi:twitching motility protein PilT